MFLQSLTPLHAALYTHTHTHTHTHLSCEYNLNSVNVHSAYDYTIGAMDKAIVKTDIQIAVPHGCYGRVGECLTCRWNPAAVVSHVIPALSVCFPQCAQVHHVLHVVENQALNISRYFHFLSSEIRPGSETLHRCWWWVFFTELENLYISLYIWTPVLSCGV